MNTDDLLAACERVNQSATPGPWEVIPVPKRSRQEVRAVDGPLIGEVCVMEAAVKYR